MYAMRRVAYLIADNAMRVCIGLYTKEGSHTEALLRATLKLSFRTSLSHQS